MTTTDAIAHAAPEPASDACHTRAVGDATGGRERGAEPWAALMSVMVILATLALLGLGGCVTAAPGVGAPGTGSPGIGNPGIGNPVVGTGNGWWTAPPNFRLSFHYSSTEGPFTAGVLSSGASDWYIAYDDGTRLAWGRMSEDGVLTGTWVRAGGLVACPIPVPPPDGLIARGFQFHQPLTVWGTFEIQFQEGGSFDGAWVGCGLPLGGPWSGRPDG